MSLAETSNPSLTQTLLYLDGVSVSFDGFNALRGLSLALMPGEMRAIIGPNGAGKTTMMDVITGKTRPDEGEVMFDGRHDLTRLDEVEIAMLGVGRKFQKPTVFENHTVEDNLLLAAKAPRSVRATLFGHEDPKTRRTIDLILAMTRLADHRGRIAGSLSHGQKQWLEIGMLLAQDPKLLLVDEPVAGMTDSETAATADLLREIARDHSVIVVEHDMAFVRELGVKVTCLHEGSVLAEGAIDQVSADPRVVEVYLGVEMLSVDRIDLFYGAAQALRSVSLKAEAGRILCVLGRNGVGKSSLLRAIVGQHGVASGSIEWNGKAMNGLPSHQRAKLGFGYVPQGREIFPLLSVKENLMTGFAAVRRNERAIDEEVFSLFPVLNDMLGRRGGDLSGGQQQQLAIARALVTKPKLLILDEPTEGIQPSIIKDIGRALVHLRRKGGMAILVVEQYFEWARDIADDYAVMDRGAVVLSGARETMNESEVRRWLTV